VRDDDEPLSRSMILLGVVIGVALSVVAVLLLWRVSHEWSQTWRVVVCALVTAALVSLGVLFAAIAGGVVDAIKGFFARR